MENVDSLRSKMVDIAEERYSGLRQSMEVSEEPDRLSAAVVSQNQFFLPVNQMFYAYESTVIWPSQPDPTLVTCPPGRQGL